MLSDLHKKSIDEAFEILPVGELMVLAGGVNKTRSPCRMSHRQWPHLCRQDDQTDKRRIDADQQGLKVVIGKKEGAVASLIEPQVKLAGIARYLPMAISLTLALTSGGFGSVIVSRLSVSKHESWL